MYFRNNYNKNQLIESNNNRKQMILFKFIYLYLIVFRTFTIIIDDPNLNVVCLIILLVWYSKYLYYTVMLFTISTNCTTHFNQHYFLNDSLLES